VSPAVTTRVHFTSLIPLPTGFSRDFQREPHLV